MISSDLSFPHIIVSLVVLIALGALISLTVIRRRRHLWEKFARKHGFRFKTETGKPRVAGSLEGRFIRLGPADVTSDTGELGAEEVQMTMEVLGKLPPGITVSERMPLVDLDDPSQDRFLTGDEEFDKRASVQGEKTEEVLAYLVQRRRNVLRELLDLGDPGRSGLSNGQIFLIEREILTGAEHLERRFQTMLTIAQTLDAEGPGLRDQAPS